MSKNAVNIFFHNQICFQPYRIGCSFTSPTTFTSATCVVTPGSSGSGTDTLTFPASGTACSGGTCTVLSGPNYSSGGSYTTVVTAMADTTTATNSADNGAQTWSDSPSGQSISSISADTTTTNSLTNMGVSFVHHL